MFTARITILSALIFSAGACTHVDDENFESVESEGKRAPGSTTTTGPTCTGDLTSDANNCGTCGNVCGSGLCYSGTCADATAGHVFVIGNGYATSNAALDKALGNAVFLKDRATVRVLAYAGASPAAFVDGTNAALGRYATANGRTWSKTAITSTADVATKINDADVFLVYAQPQASSEELFFMGDEWSLRLDNFARGGGVIVVLDTPSANAGTPNVLIRSGLLNLGGRASVIGNSFIDAAGDAGAARMPLMFANGNAVGWTPATTAASVAKSDTGLATMIHRAIY